ncbi:unnamed protein product [Somion occarium]|uniref:Uncharacterized protein n=1 Tax=Somion occarium TaxID=3059160 RepID=A0ABP1DJC3_9APHY
MASSSLSSSHLWPIVARITSANFWRLMIPIPAPYNERVAERVSCNAGPGMEYPFSNVTNRPFDATGTLAYVCCSLFLADSIKEAEVLGGDVANVDRTIARRLLWLR